MIKFKLFSMTLKGLFSKLFNKNSLLLLLILLLSMSNIYLLYKVRKYEKYYVEYEKLNINYKRLYEEYNYLNSLYDKCKNKEIPKVIENCNRDYGNVVNIYKERLRVCENILFNKNRTVRLNNNNYENIENYKNKNEKDKKEDVLMDNKQYRFNNNDNIISDDDIILDFLNKLFP